MTVAIRLPARGKMMDEIDIWRSARLLIQQHGDGAELAAAQHLDAMIERGDPAGEAVWKRVLRAIDELQRTSGGRNETLQ